MYFLCVLSRKYDFNEVAPGRLKVALKIKNSQQNLKKWPKILILACFGTFLKGPLRKIDENVLKCAGLHTRSPRAISCHFYAGLRPEKTAQCLRLSPLLGAAIYIDMTSPVREIVIF